MFISSLPKPPAGARGAICAPNGSGYEPEHTATIFIATAILAYAGMSIMFWIL